MTGWTHIRLPREAFGDDPPPGDGPDFVITKEEYFRRMEESKRKRYDNMSFAEKLRHVEIIRRELEPFRKHREARDAELSVD